MDELCTWRRVMAAVEIGGFVACLVVLIRGGVTSTWGDWLAVGGLWMLYVYGRRHARE